METCLPWWSKSFGEMAKGTQVTIASGCSVNAAGNVGCEPEAMRASAEKRLRSAGVLSSLDLQTYTLARYMHSEVGSGSIFERVAVGEAARNRARAERTTINGLLLYRQKQGHPNRGYYGPIHGIGTGTSTAPYGRWASTSRDPTVLTILLANLVTTGQSGDFSRGADDQDGPEYWAPKGQEALHNFVRREASKGQYWIGPLVGIDHWHTFLQYTPGIHVSTPQGQALLARGMAALTLPIRRPQWGDLSKLPLCSDGPVDRAALATIGVVGLFAGAWAFARGLFRGIAKPR
jgi:hypothetical protein